MPILSFDFHDQLCSFHYSIIIISILQVNKVNLVNSHGTESGQKGLQPTSVWQQDIQLSMLC